MRRFNEFLQAVVPSEPAPLENIERLQREQEVMNELLPIQFEFVRRLAEETGKPIAELVKNYTVFCDKTIATTWHLTSALAINEEVNKLSKLDGTSDQNWTNQAVQMISRVLPKPKNSARDYTPLPKVGILEFELKDIDDNDNDTIRFGFDHGVQVVEVHFPEKRIPGLATHNPKSWFSELAQIVATEQPNVEFVIGRSWLMSHPIAKRLGFHVIHSVSPENNVIAFVGDTRILVENPFHELGYWMQIIDRQGKAKAETVEYLFTKHKLPYDFSYARMDRKDFLHHYLKQQDYVT